MVGGCFCDGSFLIGPFLGFAWYRSMTVTGIMLYNMTVCEHRVALDLFEDPALRDPVHPFVEMLWRRGQDHEDDVVSDGTVEALNLQTAPLEEREQLTFEAMERGEPLIYGGRISSDDLLGEPDLLRLEDGAYSAIDIKSGVATTGDGAKPKPHYAAQLALYLDILERLGRSAGRHAYIWDRHGDEVRYDFDEPKGAKTEETLWDDHVTLLERARQIVGGDTTSPAAAAICKTCHWQSLCRDKLAATNDLTLLPELSRSRRELLLPHADTVGALAGLDPESLLDAKGKSTIKGMGADMVRKFVSRAKVFDAGGPAYAKEAIDLPDLDIEIVLDIENDAFRDHCYLHGILVRRRGKEPEYFNFFADQPTLGFERDAFARAWEMLSSFGDAAVYVYSSHEKTWWRKMQARHADVCSESDVTGLFDSDRCVDLYYGVILPKTEWPTSDFSLKSIGEHLGYRWRDSDPSGTNSMVWYDTFVNGDEECKRRLIEYNEDDCRATLRVVDGIRGLEMA
jgi:predicted RecB family nuclease